MSDPRGRRIAHRLIAAAGLLAGGTTFDTNFGVMARNEGRQEVARALLSDVLNHCPKQLTEMLDEAERERRRNAGSRSKAN